jgi:hypothetical protein
LAIGSGSTGGIIDRSATVAHNGLTAGRKALPGRVARGPSLVGLASIGIVLVVVLSGLAFLALAPSGTSAARTARGPIVIVGDAAFTTENGVVGGSGIPADPYVISGWDIPVSVGAAVTVRDTTAHFVITDVRMNGTASMSYPSYALVMTNVSNGMLSYSFANRTYPGIMLTDCRDLSLVRNDFSEMWGWAIVMSSCERVHIVANTFGTANGVYATDCTDCTVILNQMASLEVGVLFQSSDGVLAAQNTFTGVYYCVQVAGCSNVTVMGNDCTPVWSGIVLADCGNVSVLANRIQGSVQYGMNIDRCTYNVTVAHNLLNGTHGYSAILLEDSVGVVIRNNTFSNNTATSPVDFVGGGVSLEACVGVRVYHNRFVDNTPCQAEDDAGPLVNLWNLSYPDGGNFWDNWTAPDASGGATQDDGLGADGIVDNPYVFDSDCSDEYPLTTPPPVDTKPVAILAVTPSSGDTSTDINLNGTESYDPDDGCGDPFQEYRWDLQGDGQWDSDWSDDGNITRQYPAPGNYTVLLEVRDGSGLSGFAFFDLVVSEYAIPEFGTVVLPVLAMVGLFAVIARTRRKHA